jgi:hypothetical protein
MSEFCNCQIPSHSYFTTGSLPPISSSWWEVPLRLTTCNFIFQLKTCGYSPFVASSLMKRRICRLQFLLVLASPVILRSESRGTVSDSRLTQPEVPGPCIYIPQEQGGAVIPPGTGFPYHTFYDSQGFGGDIRHRLHAGYFSLQLSIP